MRIGQVLEICISVQSCFNQVSLDWECGYVECSSLDGCGVAAVFKWEDQKNPAHCFPSAQATPSLLLSYSSFIYPIPSPAGSSRHRLYCEDPRRQSGERSEPLPPLPAPQPRLCSTGCSAERIVGGNWKRLARFLSWGRICVSYHVWASMISFGSQLDANAYFLYKMRREEELRSLKNVCVLHTQCVLFFFRLMVYNLHGEFVGLWTRYLVSVWERL